MTDRPAPSHRSPGDLQRQVEAFNARFPIGQRVIVERDNGEKFRTRTRSEASVLSGHSAVIWVDGISGCYLLDRVAPAFSPEDGEQADG